MSAATRRRSVRRSGFESPAMPGPTSRLSTPSRAAAPSARASGTCSRRSRSSPAPRPSCSTRSTACRRGRLRPGLPGPAARPLARRSRVVCIKASRRIDGWLREAYFGQVLDGQPRAIRVYDAFPLPTKDGLALLPRARVREPRRPARVPAQNPRGWPERRRAARSPASWRCWSRLHRGQLLHRDLTPLNVFVCEGRQLKLGDFGLVRQQSDQRGASASTLNPINAPSDILAGTVPSGRRRTTSTRSGSSWACW